MPAETTARTILRVCDLMGALRTLVSTQFADIWVEGEVVGFKQHTSGHCYFTLKDASAQVRCVLWRSSAGAVYFAPRDGLLVRARGQVAVYETKGDLQLVVRAMELAGEGALQQAFEALKRKLAAEGLFDAARKQPLPPFPETIGIITSGTGAALHDILSILQRRFPLVRVLVCPVQVQGLGAAEAIAEAIAAFNAVPPGDPLRPAVLIVGRGGGSPEDLWAFNEEVVARALFASTIPTISAVGHETDVSISDFVADHRAATPSMAAELVVPDRRDVAQLVHSLGYTLTQGIAQRLRMGRQQVQALTRSWAFNRPTDRLRQSAQRCDDLTERLRQALPRLLERQRLHVEALQQQLLLLDPGRPLRQGYVRVARNGAQVSSAPLLHPGDIVTLHFHDGTHRARIAPPEA
jgi:exodeoxyribonuclease VII large subunit